MPQTGAERNKKYREKIKSNAILSAAYKEKDKQRKKESRKNNICSPRKAAIEKKKVRDRVRLHRLKKKLAAKAKSPTKAEEMESEYPYKTPQSLGKAVKKVTLQLPKSPRKRKAVISKIAEPAKPIFNKPTEPNANNHIPVTTIERSVGSTRPIDTILQGKEKLLEQDLILIPCNTQGSLHWFLLVVYPKQQSVVVYDSLAGSCVKPTWQHSVEKMMGLLQAVDKTVDCQKWTFKANKNNEIPQQTNAYDCGVFVCLFARCLAHKTKMVPSTSIPVFRKIMIFELCFNMLQPIPPSGICQDEYYAVHYVSNYYIGRVLEKDGYFVKFKFLHRVGAHVFDWPKRDDVDSPHTSCIFFGPVELLGNGPFQVPWQSVTEKVFKA